MAVGYDRSFADLGTRERRLIANQPTGPAVGCAGILVDKAASSVTLPDGVGFDPGGVGKGLAADLIDAGAWGVCVNLGGDIRVRGISPTGGHWLVEIEPTEPHRQVCAVTLVDGGVATSSPAVRQWRDGERTRHHLLDPRTGDSVSNDVAAVTVVAAHTWQADVLTKAVFVRGADAGLDLVESTGAAGRLLLADGTERTSATWSRFG